MNKIICSGFVNSLQCAMCVKDNRCEYQMDPSIPEHIEAMKNRISSFMGVPKDKLFQEDNTGIKRFIKLYSRG